MEVGEGRGVEMGMRGGEGSGGGTVGEWKVRSERTVEWRGAKGGMRGEGNQGRGDEKRERGMEGG